jgi:hypothetical protein
MTETISMPEVLVYYDAIQQEPEVKHGQCMKTLKYKNAVDR